MSSKKSITKNYIYNLIYEMMILILPLITTPYVSKVLGAENIGIYSYTISITTYFILFGSLGVAKYGQREIAYLQNKSDEYSKAFWEIFIVKFITMSISIIAFYFTFVLNNIYQMYYAILLLELFANCLDIGWFFQGLEEFKKTVFRSIIIKLISVICIFIFVRDSNDLALYLWIYALSTFFSNIVLWMYMPKYLKKVKITKLNLKRHIKPIINLFIPQVAIQIYTVLDKTMLGKILGNMTEVGNYEQSQKIVKMLLTLVTALGTVISPRIANYIANNKNDEIEKCLENSFRFVWLLGTPVMFGIMAIAPKLVPWFLGEEFSKSILLIIIGAPIIMAVGLNNVTGIQYLISAKKEKIFTKSVIIGAIFNFTLNLILIPKLESIGAIIASVLAETLILLIQLIYIKDYFSPKIVYKNSFKYIFSSIMMFIITYFVGFFMKPVISTTVIQIIIAILVYGLLLVVLKDKFVFQIINKFKKNAMEGKNEIF